MAGIPQQVQAQITAIRNALEGDNQNYRDFVQNINQRLNRVNAEIRRLNGELNDALASAERGKQQQQLIPPNPPTSPNAPNAPDCQQYINVIDDLHGRIGRIIGKLEDDIGGPINNIIREFPRNGSGGGGGGLIGGLFSGGSKRRRKMHSKKRKHHRSRKI